jgi:hypothetical protein
MSRRRRSGKKGGGGKGIKSFTQGRKPKGKRVRSYGNSRGGIRF